jgi:glucosamine--fructose-6-phosphate aminotransferase (isomerizing)
MCGIVGYLGPRKPKDVILTGLRALEYRGYDSAGLAILDGGRFRRVRAQGKLEQLEFRLANEQFDGNVGIGHTRWATHGVPSEQNAHPHSKGGVSLVHNGIIENCFQLKEQLILQGATFESETDTELLAHLINREIAMTQDLQTAVQNVIPRLHGAYAVVVVWEDQPDTMVAFTNGPPLLMGVGKDEITIASDVQALAEHTQDVVYLEDGEIVCVQGQNFALFSLDGKRLTKTTTHVEWAKNRASKGDYPHFMLKEIFEQPDAVRAAIAPHINRSAQQLVFTPETELPAAQIDLLLAKTERIIMVGCGSAFYSGMVGASMIERLARIPVEYHVASEFRYGRPVFPPHSLLLSISQSGETADTLAAIRMAKAEGLKVLSICNAKRSSIDREADLRLYMNCGPEVGVASTKSFSSTLALFGVLALAFAKSHQRLTAVDERQYLQELLEVPSLMKSALALDVYIRQEIAQLKLFKGFLFLGRGAHYPIALEGALKLKELAYLHAEGYPAGEMKHGPLALIDERMAVVVLAPRDELFEKTLSNLEEAKARSAHIISIGTGSSARLESLSDHCLVLPKASWLTQPLLEVLPLQLLAYRMAESLGYDVDQPRNLAKSVTVE